MTYTPLIPPRDYPMFKDMKPKEAKEFFEWFVGEMDNRIEILKQVVKEDGFNMKFDYSPESLIPLWEWYETKIKYIEKSDEEYKKDLEGRPEWMIPYVSKEKLSYETFNYGVDVAMYVAKVFMKNTNNKIHFGFYTKPKKDAFVNEPVLLGFKYGISLCLRNNINVLAKKTYEKGNDKYRLYNMYHNWIKDYL